MLLISDRPPRVAREYRDALAVADRFAIGAADRNIQIFRSLRLLEANVAAALREIEAASSHAGAGSAMEPAARVILLPVTWWISRIRRRGTNDFRAVFKRNAGPDR